MNLNEMSFINIPATGSRPAESEDLFQMRQSVCEACAYDDTEVTILITNYNRGNKLKNCIDSIRRCTRDVSYRILITDSSDEPETLDYLHSLKQPDIQVLHVDGAYCQVAYKTFIALGMVHTPYVARLANDMIVTENWLSNLLRCLKSDPSIGLAVPMMTNVSNLQQVSFQISDRNELAVRAKLFNRSDPKKWRERLRLIDPLAVNPTSMFSAVGGYDFAYIHDFLEDDLAYRMRAAGYKLMLCEDTFVHHDHDFRNFEDKDPAEFEESLRIGRNQYKRKRHGLDAWDDVNNYEPELLSAFYPSPKSTAPQILGIDCLMGTPILEVKNKYRSVGVFDAQCHAFTTQAKYFADLQTICGDNVICDREEYFFSYYERSCFDAIVLGQPFNAYRNPYALLDAAFALLKEGGQLLFKLKNRQSAIDFCQIVGQPVNTEDKTYYASISVDDLAAHLQSMGIKDVRLTNSNLNSNDSFQSNMRTIINAMHPNNQQAADEHLTRIFTDQYFICVVK